jgi:predicted RNA methylase
MNQILLPFQDANESPPIPAETTVITAVVSSATIQQRRQAERLRNMAERMTASAEAKLADRETNTARKLKMAMSARREGHQLLRAAEYAETIAVALENGALPSSLSAWKPTKSGLLEIAAQRGRSVSNGFHGYLVDNGEFYDESAEAVAVRTLAEAAKSDVECEAEALRQQRERIRQMEAELHGCCIPGFFPTPAPIIDEMLRVADISPEHRVIEPSAGKGDIAEAVKALYPEGFLDCIEIVPRLCEILGAKGLHHHRFDFLEWNGTKYDRIVMNPPFENGQDIEHLQHAFSLLREGGRIVSIMSCGPFFRSDRKAKGFREWFETHNSKGWYKDLPEGSFKPATGVATKLVVIDK